MTAGLPCQSCSLLQAALAQQSDVAEAAAARQLAFIDRLLADKEGLARRCEEGDRLLKVGVCALSFCLGLA